MDYEEKRVVIGPCMILEKVGEIVEVGCEDRIREENGDKEVEVSMSVVLMVEEGKSEV